MPNQHSGEWSPAHIAKAKKILSKHVSLAEAAKEISKTLDRYVSATSLEKAIGRHTGSHPRTFMKPAPHKKLWTEQRINDLIAILAKHTKLDAALYAEVSAKLDINATRDIIDRCLQRAGRGTAVQHLKPAPVAAVHPIEAQEKREKHKEQKKTIEELAYELREANKRQAFLDKIAAHHEPPHILRRERASGMREATAVVLASDWHVEEEVDPESIAGRNEYNLDIATERIERFFNAIVWNIEHQRASKKVAVRDLVLWLGGDLMSGYIHEELAESNALSPTETILWLLPRLNGGLRSLQERLDLNSIIVPCSYGNHGRTTKKPRISTGPQNSYEWLMYNNLQRELANEKRIRFEITKSGHQYVQAYDFTLHFHHGDDVNYQGGVGGIGIPLLKAVDAWNEVVRSDYHNIGHWHQLKNYGSAMVNGSLIGYNPYAQRIKARFEEPKQMFYLVDSMRGQCMYTPLWVGEQSQIHTTPWFGSKKK